MSVCIRYPVMKILLLNVCIYIHLYIYTYWQLYIHRENLSVLGEPDARVGAANAKYMLMWTCSLHPLRSVYKRARLLLNILQINRYRKQLVFVNKLTQVPWSP